MKVSVVTLAAVMSLGGAVANAQVVNPACTDPSFVGPFQAGGDACQKAVDLYRYMNMQLGTLLAGGNATLGQGGTLGGLGHFALELRATAMQASLPDLEATGVTPGPAQSNAFSVKDQWAGLPVADAAIGLFKGIPLGVTSVGGVDALVNVAYLPEFNSSSVSVKTPAGSLKWGFGARLGVLKETPLIPGLSLTYFRRDLPTTGITAIASSTDSVSVQDYAVKTTAWRVVASKNFFILGLAAGIGKDKYKAKADLSYNVDANTPAQPITLGIEPTRTNMFFDASLNLLVLKIVGEVGSVSGGDVSTFNTFDKKADAKRYYGSVGIRLGH